MKVTPATEFRVNCLLIVKRYRRHKRSIDHPEVVSMKRLSRSGCRLVVLSVGFHAHQSHAHHHSRDVYFLQLKLPARKETIQPHIAAQAWHCLWLPSSRQAVGEYSTLLCLMYNMTTCPVASCKWIWQKTAIIQASRTRPYYLLHSANNALGRVFTM